MSAEIRRAGPEDAAGLAALAERTFREAFAGSNPPGEIDAYCADAFSADIQGRELADPAWTTFLAEEDGRAVGYAQVVAGPAPEGVGPGPAVALRRIYVERARQGTGVARDLLQVVREEARARGGHVLWLAVWERNARAVRFYGKEGFRIVGGQSFRLGSLVQSDHVMAAALRPVRVSLAEKLALFDERWSPRIVGELNGQQVKLAKLEGPFVWHRHAGEDELFLVLAGRLTIELRDGVVSLGPGELTVVPRGVEHRPVAHGECHVLLFEPASTLNTGDVRNERTVERLERV